MEIIKTQTGRLGANCYMFSTESAAFIVDVGMFSEDVREFAEKNSGKQFYILLTHGHFDHILGAYDAKEFTGGKIVIDEKDAAALYDTKLSLAAHFHFKQSETKADITVNDAQKLNLGGLIITVMETPGHTVGSVCYIIGDVIFSGDTLFYQNIGKTDFEGGSFDSILDSLRRLKNLDGNYRVLPGHGEETTLDFERNNNSFMVNL